jgi:membrane-associated phospholipid phosphatase
MFLSAMKVMFLIFIILFTFTASAEEGPELFGDFWKNTKASFSKDKAYYHLAAIAATPLLIETGVDGKVHDSFKATDTAPFSPAVVGGWIAPVILVAPIYAYGKLKSDNKAVGASYALVQTSIITLTYISTLKALTGRHQPDNNSPHSSRRQSENFRFGFLNNGIDEGWPSGHLAITTALLTTLTHYYHEKLWLKWTMRATLAYMLLAVAGAEHGQMHWFSDEVAGALMGYAIGSTVGTNMRASFDGETSNESYAKILPILGPKSSGIQVVWNY